MWDLATYILFRKYPKANTRADWLKQCIYNSIETQNNHDLLT